MWKTGARVHGLSETTAYIKSLWPSSVKLWLCVTQVTSGKESRGFYRADLGLQVRSVLSAPKSRGLGNRYGNQYHNWVLARLSSKFLEFVWKETTAYCLTTEEGWLTCVQSGDLSLPGSRSRFDICAWLQLATLKENSINWSTPCCLPHNLLELIVWEQPFSVPLIR